MTTTEKYIHIRCATPKCLAHVGPCQSYEAAEDIAKWKRWSLRDGKWWCRVCSSLRARNG